MVKVCVLRSGPRGNSTLIWNPVFRIGSFTVKPFKVIHDSPGGSVGFCIYAKTGRTAHKISLATDLSASTKRIQAHLKDSRILLLSSNHDPEMLRRDERIPGHTKELHIIRCHMSNHECAELLDQVVRSSRIKPALIYLLHISPAINTVGKALAKSRYRLRQAGQAEITVRPTYAHKPSRVGRLDASPQASISGRTGSGRRR